MDFWSELLTPRYINLELVFAARLFLQSRKVRRVAWSRLVN